MLSWLAVVCATVIVLQMELHHKVKVCGCICRQSSEHICPFSFLFSECADEH